MEQPGSCPSCGGPLADSRLCPRCAFGLAAQTEPANFERGALELPRVFGNYELLEAIGEGGSGVVYRARRQHLNQTVAVKMLRSGLLASYHEIERFQQEVRALGALQHPGIVPVFEVGHVEGRVYYSMEYISGPSLAALPGNRPLSPAEAAACVKKLAEAMQHVHSSGVFHRDLKPGNVLIDRHGQPRIADFGLAKLSGRETMITQPGDLLGTPSYMPPEQAQGGQQEITAASDIYSLGAILYFLLTGEPPFRGATPLDTIRQVVESEAASPRVKNAQTPKDLETICLKCLRKEPRHRYSSAGELAEDLGRFLAFEPIQARPITLSYRLVRWSQRNPGLARGAAAITILMLMLAVAAFLFWRDTRETSELLAFMAAKEVTGGLHKLAVLVAAAASAPELSRFLTSARDEPLEEEFQPSLTPPGVEVPDWIKLQNWLLLDASGQPVARWPGPFIDFNRVARDYFIGPARQTGGGTNAVWISKIYQSRDDGRFKFGVSTAIRGTRGELLGVFALMVDTRNFAELIPGTVNRKILLIGEPDPSTIEIAPANVPARWRNLQMAWRPETAHVLLMHPEFGTNNLALPLSRRTVKKLFRSRQSVAGRNSWSVRYRDLVADVDKSYEGSWIAGVASVPNSPFTVIYQTRDRLAEAMITLALAALALALALAGARLVHFWRLRRKSL